MGGTVDGDGTADSDGTWRGLVAVASCVPTRKPHQSQYSPDTAELQRGQDAAAAAAAAGLGAWCFPASRAWPEAGLAGIRVPQTSQKSALADS